jgi:hypothetical protein
MARYCANCGTEVDDTAVFCPTCGQPIDQAAETEIPAAPAWPDPAREPEGAYAPPRDQVADEVEPRIEDPTRVEAAPPPPVPPPAVARPAPGETPPPRAEPRQLNLPVTWPVTLSAWLIGVGAVVGALGVLISLFRGVINPVDVLLLLLLLAIAVTVFFAANVPAIPHLRLGTLVVVLIGFGIALDRIGFGVAGIGELLMFLGTAAAGMGCILLELGRDQPLGGPRP